MTLMLMDDLADTLAHEGHYEDSKRLLQKVLSIRRRILGTEDPATASTSYKLACIAARRGRRDEALSLLSEAIDHGLPPNGDLGIEKEPDFKSLRSDTRFAALIARAKQRAAAARKPN